MSVKEKSETVSGIISEVRSGKRWIVSVPSGIIVLGLILPGDVAEWLRTV